MVCKCFQFGQVWILGPIKLNQILAFSWRFYLEKHKLISFVTWHFFSPLSVKIKAHRKAVWSKLHFNINKFHWIKYVLYLCGIFVDFSFDIYLEVKQWYTDIHKLEYENYKTVDGYYQNFHWLQPGSIKWIMVSKPGFSSLSPSSIQLLTPSILTANEAMFVYKADKIWKKSTVQW